ncbi:hypothetical protein COCNU_07G012490 [Cocos nucifera]|uniref:HMG box domain-containing protein n=1 Tax=Cocos nucifera TaxID=13894 RepID=A0A8K0IGD0_COCNU|nr:hypothetical protein COCNU_07G012490 [Cocos nucifera]
MLQITDLKDSPSLSKKELRIAIKQVVQLLQDNHPEFVEREGLFEAKASHVRFLTVLPERRATLLEQNKNALEIAKIAGEEWKNMTEEQRAPYEEIAKKCKDEYNQQMELYKQNKLEEAANLEKEKEELKQFLKQEALQLLKKKEKTENIIKHGSKKTTVGEMTRNWQFYTECSDFSKMEDMGFGVLRLVCGLQRFTLRYAGVLLCLRR